MLVYIVKRLLGAIPTLVLVTVAVFPVRARAAGRPALASQPAPDADQATVLLVRHQLGLDLPLPEQFVRYVVNLVHGNLGVSLRTQRPVLREILDRFMPTFILTVTSMVWSVVFGLVVGVVSAVWRNRPPDAIGMTLAVSGISFPAFALGMVLMQVFSVQLGWLPAIGAGSGSTTSCRRSRSAPAWPP